MYATIALFLSVLTVGRCHDLMAGHREDGRKIYDENATASPALWRQINEVRVNASEGEVVSRVVVTDLRLEKDGEVKIINGGIGDKYITLELKSPTVLRGYDFKIEVYSVFQTENGAKDVINIPPEVNTPLEQDTPIQPDSPAFSSNTPTNKQDDLSMYQDNSKVSSGDKYMMERETADHHSLTSVEHSNVTSTSDHPRNITEISPPFDYKSVTTESSTLTLQGMTGRPKELMQTSFENYPRAGRDINVGSSNESDLKVNEVQKSLGQTTTTSRPKDTMVKEETEKEGNNSTFVNSDVHREYMGSYTTESVQTNQRVLRDTASSTTDKGKTSFNSDYATTSNSNPSLIKSSQSTSSRPVTPSLQNTGINNTSTEDDDDDISKQLDTPDKVNLSREYRETIKDAKDDTNQKSLPKIPRALVSDFDHSAGENITPYVYVHHMTESTRRLGDAGVTQASDMTNSSTYSSLGSSSSPTTKKTNISFSKFLALKL